MRGFKKIGYTLFIGIMAVSVTSCGDEPSSGQGTENIDKNKPVADPEGTISLAMNNSSQNKPTYLGDIYIGSDNNFIGDNYSGTTMYFADLGSVAGLGNITAIPVSGWATKVQVIPNHGYVAVQFYQSSDYWTGVVTKEIRQIYRIFVSDYITSTTGGVMGADIKYQKPFDAADVDIRVDKADVMLSADKTSALVKIENKSFVPFEIEQEGFPFTVLPVYDSEVPFIITGIDIRCPENTAAVKELKSSVILKTRSGKKTEIKVTQIAADPYITLTQSELKFDSQGLKEKYFSFDSNVAYDVEVSTSDEWIRVDLMNNEDVWSKQSVAVITSTNCSTESRIGYVTMKYGDVVKHVKIEQSGFDVLPQLPEVYEIEAKAYTGYNPIVINLYPTQPTGVLMDQNMFKVESDEYYFYNLEIHPDSWGASPYIYLNAGENISRDPREGIIKLFYSQNGYFDDILVSTVTIRQAGKQ